MTDFLTRFAQELKKRREAKGKSQNYMAVRAMVSQAQWKKWELGTAYPSLPMLPRVAAALGCNVVDLVR